MAYSPKPNHEHVKQGVAKFIEQYKNKPKLAALLASYLKHVQRIEDAAWEVILFRTLADSEGAQLDYLGKLVGGIAKTRAGLDDDNFRIVIRAQIRINRSCGTTVDIFEVANLSLPTGFTFTYDEEQAATIVIAIDQAPTFNVTTVFTNLVHTKSGGVRLLFIWYPSGPENTFRFSDNTNPDTALIDPLIGFGNTDPPTTGGHFAGVLDSST